MNPDEWEVTSIENARAGIATAVGDSSRTRSYDMVAEASGEAGNVFDLRFATTPVMLLVVDTAYPMWATGNANVVAGLANMYVTIKFTPLDWKEGRMNRWSRRRGNSTATRMSIFPYGRNCG